MSGTGLRSIRILVVEDSDDLSFILKTELEFLGYNVVVAQDGITALDAATQFRPDLILSDIRMPGIDGFEFVARVRKLKELATVPVVALTGFGLDRDVAQALSRGFTAHVTKPVDPATLSSLIQRLVAEKRASVGSDSSSK